MALPGWFFPIPEDAECIPAAGTSAGLQPQEPRAPQGLPRELPDFPPGLGLVWFQHGAESSAVPGARGGSASAVCGYRVSQHRHSSHPDKPKRNVFYQLGKVGKASSVRIQHGSPQQGGICSVSHQDKSLLLCWSSVLFTERELFWVCTSPPWSQLGHLMSAEGMSSKAPRLQGRCISALQFMEPWKGLAGSGPSVQVTESWNGLGWEGSERSAGSSWAGTALTISEG